MLLAIYSISTTTRKQNIKFKTYISSISNQIT